VRGLLIVNMHATTTSPRVTDVLVHALAGEIDLEVARTERRGHARELAERAQRERLDVLCTLGGDGTINEAVNGLLVNGPASDLPLLVTVPGGSANVIPRSLGLSPDPVEATGEILEALREGRRRRISVGKATATDAAGVVCAPQWFVANAGMGIDAEIIAAMEEQRSVGREATPSRYLRTTLRQFFAGTDRRHPALTVQSMPGEFVTTGDEDGAVSDEPNEGDTAEASLPGQIDGVFLAIVQNTAPWTYLGTKAINPCPQASYDTGLDLFAVRRLGVPAALRLARRMIVGSEAGSTKRSLTVLHDQDRIELQADPPTRLQIDGEGFAPMSRVVLESVPDALGVIC
jgi:diacylglycerol kinase family enzyme